MVCYTDSQMALELSISTVRATHQYTVLLWEIHNLLARDWNVEVLHTLREANKSADALAKIGANQREWLLVVSSPPAALCVSLRAEAMRLLHRRV